MTDIFERAEALEQFDRDIALRVRKPTLITCGHCFNCNEPLHDGLLYCDKDCAIDHERETESQKRNGS